MFCTSCGKEVPNGYRFCTCCGSPMKGAEAETTGYRETPSGLKINMRKREPDAEYERATGDGAPDYSGYGASAHDGYRAPSPEPKAVPVAAPVRPDYGSAPYAAPKPATVPAPESFFDGGFFGLLGVNLAISFLSILSLGFAYPWLYCFKLRWFYEHTCINGYRLQFDGRGHQIFGKWMLWFFLTIITAGIFALWIPIKLKKWETKHVSLGAVIIRR